MINISEESFKLITEINAVGSLELAKNLVDNLEEAESFDDLYDILEDIQELNKAVTARALLAQIAENPVDHEELVKYHKRILDNNTKHTNNDE